MASVNLRGQGNTSEIAALLTDQIQESALSCELVDSIYHEIEGLTVHLLVFDKYYMRTSSRASLTVSIIGHGGTVYVDAVGSGGGQGLLLSYSWGAEENFVNIVADILGQYGFCTA